VPDSTRRSRRRLRKRRLYARSLAAGAVAAAVTAGIVVPFGMAGAGGGGQHARAVRHPGLAVGSALVAAGEQAQERVAVEQFSRAVFEHAAFERAVNDTTKRDSIWDAIAACETQGNWHMQGSSFSGGVGFSNSAWDSFGGRQFAPNAGQATREQQIVVAERIQSSVGLGAWGCARTLGLT
jgi:hypothetical protein